MSSAARLSIGWFSLAALSRYWQRWQSGWRAWSRTGSRYLPFLLKRRRELSLALGFGVGYALLGMAEPWVLKLIVDNVVLGHPLPALVDRVLPGATTDRITLLNVLLVGLVLLVVLRGIFYYYQQLLSARVGQNTAAEIRLTLYKHLHQLCARFHDHRRTGDVLNRLNADVKQLRDIFVSLPLTVAGELVLLAGMLGVMFLMDARLALLALAALPGIAILLRTYQRPLRQAIRTQREREGHLAHLANETLGAIRIVQGYTREDWEVERFSSQNRRSLRTGMRAARLEAKLHWFSEITVVVVTALVISLAARSVLAGALSPGELLVFIAYLRSFNRPLRRVSKMAERAARGAAAGDRVLEILDTEPVVRNLPGARRARALSGRIAFERVSLEHQSGQLVLNDIDLHIEAGQRVAVVGMTGSGKTSLLNLIPRFYDPTAGRVCIDGRDIRDFKLESLREQIAYVFQEPVLFATTIGEAIAYGRPGVSGPEIEAAARGAGIHDIITSLPAAYDTVLGERGATLSGGQRQCVAIARAMIRNAPIVLLDEPLTGLDRQSSALVAQALRRLVEGRTVVFISHDIASARDADLVVVMQAGRIVDLDTPDALLRRDGLFRSFHQLELQAAS